MSAERTSYGPADVAAVKRVMDRHVGPENAADIVQIVKECDLAERKVRQILSDYDGVAMLQGECDAGRFVARTAEEAESMSAKLRARAVNEMARCDRRDAYAQAMKVRPVEQASMGLAS